MTAAVKAEGRPEFTISASLNIADQVANVLGATKLYELWSDEDAFDCDTDAYIRELLGWIRDGTGLLCVAWAGEEPAGMMEFHRQYDCAQSRWRMWGERLYIAEQFRGHGLMHLIEDAMDAYTWLTGCTQQIINVGLENPSLLAWYERRMGFKQDAVLLSREVRHG